MRRVNSDETTCISVRSVEAYLSLGDCLATSNRHAEAERVLKKCLVLDGSRVKDIRTHVAAKKSCALRLGRMYASAGKHQYAVNVFESSIRSEESPSSQVNSLFFILKLYMYMYAIHKFQVK